MGILLSGTDIWAKSPGASCAKGTYQQNPSVFTFTLQYTKSDLNVEMLRALSP